MLLGMTFEKREFVMKQAGILLSVSVVCWLVAGARGDERVKKLPLDNDFLIKVATCNQAEIAICKIAETRGSLAVKGFAAYVRPVYVASYGKLADLLKTRKIGVAPGAESETKKEIKRLGDLTGADFDRQFLKWVIKEHESGISLIENQIKQGKDDDVRAFAKETLETVRKDLKGAEELAKTVGSK